MLVIFVKVILKLLLLLLSILYYLFVCHLHISFLYIRVIVHVIILNVHVTYAYLCFLLCKYLCCDVILYINCYWLTYLVYLNPQKIAKEKKFATSSICRLISHFGYELVNVRVYVSCIHV